MAARAHIKDRTKLAAALCIVLDIPHEDQKRMHEDHVLSLVQWDHWPVRKVDGGSDLFSNLRPLLIGAHRVKTATRDIPEIAKGKRLRAREAQHRIKRLIVGADETGAIEVIAKPRRKRSIPSRPFPKQHRPLRSRNTFQRSRP